jgi:hypothetical protein
MVLATPSLLVIYVTVIAVLGLVSSDVELFMR